MAFQSVSTFAVAGARVVPDNHEELSLKAAHHFSIFGKLNQLLRPIWETENGHYLFLVIVINV